jgi:hypothetical protein
MLWTGLFWLMTGTTASACKNSNDQWVSLKFGKTFKHLRDLTKH